MSKEDNYEGLKYLLGNMGIEIFIAISQGAKDFETIKIFSGVPLECIKGRVPVLLDLNLIIEDETGYNISQKGFDFKKLIDKFSLN
jgi:predicted transcriptional regulator